MDATTRWLAGFAALCAISLSAVLLGEFRSSQVQAKVAMERFSPEAGLLSQLEASDVPRIHLEGQPSETAPPPLFLREGTRDWFRVDITLPPEVSTEPLIASFSQGLVVPDRVWLKLAISGSVDTSGGRVMSTRNQSRVPSRRNSGGGAVSDG